MAPSPSPSSLRPRRVSSSHQNPSGLSCSPTCKHSPSATLDLLILILVLFSCTFLISSSLSYLFHSLSLLLPSLSLSLSLSIPAAAPLLALLAVAVAVAVLLLVLSLAAALPWSRRRCSNPRCKGLKKALEFDVQLQTEEAIRASPQDAAWRTIDELPWKGGQGGNNPDYERLRAELRRMAPPNGRAVLLFRLRCGCPVSKLEAWGPKRGRKPKKGMAKLALEGVNR